MTWTTKIHYFIFWQVIYHFQGLFIINPIVCLYELKYCMRWSSTIYNNIHEKLLNSDWLRKELSSPLTRVHIFNTGANDKRFMIGWKSKRKLREPISWNLFSLQSFKKWTRFAAINDLILHAKQQKNS